MKKSEHNKNNALKSMIISSLSFLILGIIMIVWSKSVETAFCYIIGAALTVYGVFNIISFFLSLETTAVLELITGILSTAIGVFTLISPSSIIGIVFFIIGIMIIIVSIIELKYAFMLKALNMKYWWIYFILSVIVIILGLCTILFSDFFANIIMIFLGILLIYVGISGFSLLFFTSRYSNKSEKNSRMIDAEASDID